MAQTNVSEKVSLVQLPLIERPIDILQRQSKKKGIKIVGLEKLQKRQDQRMPTD